LKDNAYEGDEKSINLNEKVIALRAGLISYFNGLKGMYN